MRERQRRYEKSAKGRANSVLRNRRYRQNNPLKQVQMDTLRRARNALERSLELAELHQ